MPLSNEELAIRQRLKDDLEHYASRCLKIRTKSGATEPFLFNRAQKFCHAKLEEQRRQTGRVRALTLKGRQQGISTLISGRFYHRATHSRGCRVFILTHEDAATQNLFEMVNRFHENCPAAVRPSTGAANAKELFFDRLDSGYKVGTAGSKGVGRSSTIQLFHGCLSPETPVMDGVTGKLRPMGSLAIGDMVRTHVGNVAAVSFISHQRKSALRFLLRGMQDFPLVATGEHRFWTKSGWQESSELRVGDCVGFPVHTIYHDDMAWDFRLPNSFRPQGGGSAEVGPSSVEPDYNIGRILGLFLAEGCVLKQSATREPSAITFSVHEREVGRTVEWLEPLKGLFRSIKVAPHKNSKTVSVTAYGRSFATFVRARCGELDGKRLPSEWNWCGVEFVRGLVHGYLAGDGHSSKSANDRRIRATSIRSAITTGMRDALAALGYGWACIEHKAAAIRFGRNEREAWILALCGDGVDRLVSELGWNMPMRKRKSSNYTTMRVVDGYAWTPIVRVDDIGETDVMDFEIDHVDHSYCILHGATHNSEAAFWPNAEQHAAGILQAVPDENGTEIILESTANGMGNFFHQKWTDAERGKTDFIPIFIPWFWQEEYRRVPGKDFVLDDEESEYAEMHGLTLDQMAWRRAKIADLKDPLLVKQEFPATAQEAFQTTGHDSFIKPADVLRARKAKLEGFGPLVMGVDPARFGDDRFSIAYRQGRKVHAIASRQKIDVVSGANWVKSEIDEMRPDRCFIDVGGLGAGVYDILVSWGAPYTRICAAVNFGSAAQRDFEVLEDGSKRPGPKLRRDEMWSRMRDWLCAVGGADIPDDDALHADLCAPGYKYDMNSRLILESKEHMRARGVASPDEGDAMCLTFAEPVIVQEEVYPDFEGADDGYSSRSDVTGY